MKTQVLQSLGETGLALPSQIEAGLAANDRLKYYFSLLQLARAHADRPDRPTSSLKQERLAAGIRDGDLDDVVAVTRRQDAAYRLPGAGALLAAIAADARIMAVPVEAGAKERLETLLTRLPKANGDLIDGTAIDQITRADHDRADSLHRLVMDLHKALNALQAGLA